MQFRKHLGSLAERILELSFGGVTVKFDKLLTKGAELIEQTTEDQPEESVDEMTKNLTRYLDRIKDLRSQQADEWQAMVLFKDIELKLIDIGTALGLTPQKGRLSGRDVVRHLRSQKQIDSGFAQLFDTLQEGRNLLVWKAKSEGDQGIRPPSIVLPGSIGNVEGTAGQERRPTARVSGQDTFRDHNLHLRRGSCGQGSFAPKPRFSSAIST